MDPNTTLTAIRRILASRGPDGEISANDGERLADLVAALDGWLDRGGFLPSSWNLAWVKMRAPDTGKARNPGCRCCHVGIPCDCCPIHRRSPGGFVAKARNPGCRCCHVGISCDCCPIHRRSPGGFVANDTDLSGQLWGGFGRDDHSDDEVG